MALFISGVLIGFSLVLQLGTGNIGLIRTGVNKGFLPAFIFSLGCAVGDGLYATLSVFGVGLLLQSSTIFQSVMWQIKVRYLLSLASLRFQSYGERSWHT